MSQYSNQQYGQGAQSGQDEPSAGQYGNEQQGSSAGYGGQQDSGYGGQEDPNSQQNGYPNGQEQDGQEEDAQNPNQQIQKPKGRGGMLRRQPNGVDGAMTQENAGIDPRHAHYDPTHHNALHHAGKVAKGGFTAKHMDAALQLGMYALGSLANTHGLAPEAPHPGDRQPEPMQ